MDDYYDNEKNWLFPEVNKEPLDDMSEAEGFLASEFEKNKEKQIVIGFSCGKDSLATLALATKVLRRMNDKRRPIILTSITKYEQKDFAPWFDYLQSTLFPRYNWLCIKPTELTSYIVETIGIGMPPVNMPNLRACNNRWKVLPLRLGKKILKEKYGGYMTLSGLRAEESFRRRSRLEESGRASIISGDLIYQPLAWITTKTLWAWLEENLEEYTGVSFDRLKDYYATKKRDGCWLCSYHNDWSDLTPFQRWVQGFQKEIWDEADIVFPTEKKDPGVKRRVIQLTPYATRGCRSSLEDRKKWFDKILEADKKFGEGYIKQIHIDFIHEIWNYTERYKDDYGQYAGVNHWNHYKEDYLPHMMKPYLRDVAFVTKTTKSGKVIDNVRKGIVEFFNIREE